MSGNRYVLHYMDLRATGENLRWLLQVTNAKYREETIELTEWPKRKPSNYYQCLLFVKLNNNLRLCLL